MPPAAGIGGSGATAGFGLVAAVLLAVAWDALSSLWYRMLENVLPIAFVVLFILAAAGWGFLGGVGNGGSSGGAAGSGVLAHRQGQGQQERQGAQGRGLHRRHGSSRQLLAALSNEREVELVSLHGSGAARTSSGGGGSLSSSRSSSSAALVPVPDSSGALIETTSFSCPKPLGCGYRHTCPDTGRSWMACDRHGYHSAPRAGSVWREAVPDGQPSAGQVRLFLAWEGRVLDVTEIGHCRGWDRQLTAEAFALLNLGQRIKGMCSKSSKYPRLEKLEEVLGMDYKGVARGRKVWNMLERWLGRKQEQQRRGGGCGQPLAVAASYPAAHNS